MHKTTREHLKVEELEGPKIGYKPLSVLNVSSNKFLSREFICSSFLIDSFNLQSMV